MTCCIAIAAVLAAFGWLVRPRRTGRAQEWRLEP